MRPVTAHPASTGTPGHNPVRLSSEAPLVTDLSLDDLERDARHAIGEMAYAYYAGGADDERLLAGNVAAWAHWQLHPRVLAGIAEVTPATSLLGTPVSSPVAIAPTAIQGLAHRRGGGGDGAGRRRGGRTHDPVVPRHLPAGGRGGRGAGRAALDAGVHLAGAGAHRRAGQPGRRARLRRAGPDRRRAGVGPPTARMAHGRAPARRPGAAQPGRRQHRPRARGGLHGRGDPRVRARTDSRRHRVAGGAQCAPRRRQGGATGGRRPAVHGGGSGGHRGLEPRRAPAGRRPGDGRHLGRDRRCRGRAGRGLRRRRPPALPRRGQGAGAGARAALVGRPSLWALATGGADGVAALLRWYESELRRAMALCGAATVDELDRSLVRRAPGWAIEGRLP